MKKSLPLFDQIFSFTILTFSRVAVGCQLEDKLLPV